MLSLFLIPCENRPTMKGKNLLLVGRSGANSFLLLQTYLTRGFVCRIACPGAKIAKSLLNVFSPLKLLFTVKPR